MIYVRSIPLHLLVDQVHDEKTFLIFLKALMDGRIDEVEKEKISLSSPYGAGANGWQNDTIEGFLEAAIAWAEDSKRGIGDVESGTNASEKIVLILYMGKCMSKETKTARALYIPFDHTTAVGLPYSHTRNITICPPTTC
ncbi:hypothetical protein [Pelosinus sp. IPA-1]|uniref:hypothetical protein n=1 Tax=Pelosinus sp. IPA-1 TaxID=3029569 RepID=UPI0024361C12|nr:hypothetical protein [Pelosinus sp. IPA-1]GMA99566.1 hypothetical protein PIPA1_23660 [Pelosinus sp. IPA-1]